MGIFHALTYCSDLFYGQNYLKIAQKLNDIHINRDAWKKLANVYIEIASGEPPFGSNGGTEVFAAIEDLEPFSPEVVEENERLDLMWLRKFSKARSIYCFRKMREL